MFLKTMHYNEQEFSLKPFNSENYKFEKEEVEETPSWPITCKQLYK